MCFLFSCLVYLFVYILPMFVLYKHIWRPSVAIFKDEVWNEKFLGLGQRKILIRLKMREKSHLVDPFTASVRHGVQMKVIYTMDVT